MSCSAVFRPSQLGHPVSRLCPGDLTPRLPTLLLRSATMTRALTTRTPKVIRELEVSPGRCLIPHLPPVPARGLPAATTKRTMTVCSQCAFSSPLDAECAYYVSDAEDPRPK
jgi:hypothetical protein